MTVGFFRKFCIGGKRNIYIGYNEALTNLHGLGGLTSVGDQLHITGNPSLSSLEGLTALNQIAHYLRIYANVALPDCEICELAEQLDDGPAGFQVQGNFADECTPVPDNCE